jgi:hypothetical protein
MLLPSWDRPPAAMLLIPSPARCAGEGAEGLLICRWHEHPRPPYAARHVPMQESQPTHKANHHRNPMSPSPSNQWLSTLALARHFLLGAALVHLLLFLPKGLFPVEKTYNIVLFVSAFLGICGFVIAYKQLKLKEEALENSNIWPYLGSRLKAGAIMMFCMTFFIPIINLVIIAWTYFKIRSSIKYLETERQHQLERDARRAKFR